MTIASTQLAGERYLVDDVDRAVDFYTSCLGFTLGHCAAPAFPDVTRSPRRLLLSGPTGSGTRPIPELSPLTPGGWDRIHLIVDDITAEVARVRMAGLSFRNSIIGGRAGQQILLHDPVGNLIELFDPVNR